MNICNVTSNNFNLDCNGKDMQIEVYEQLIEQLQQENKILKENSYHNDKVVDKVNWENKLLKQKIKKYKEVIDKAIEYLEEPNRDSFDYSKVKLLEILKGDY